MKDLKWLGGVIGSGVSASSVALSSAEVDHIVSIVCAIIGVIITLVSCLLIPLIKWYKKAKEDGKISKEELEEGKEIVSNGIEEVKNSIESEKNKKK